MKYEVKENTIKEYEVNGSEILINYVKGMSQAVPYSTYTLAELNKEMLEDAKKLIEELDTIKMTIDEYQATFKENLGTQLFVTLFFTTSSSMFATMVLKSDKVPTPLKFAVGLAWLGIVCANLIGIKKACDWDKLSYKEENKAYYIEGLKEYVSLVEKSNEIVNDPKLRSISHLLPRVEINKFDRIYDCGEKSFNNYIKKTNEKCNIAKGISESGILDSNIDLGDNIDNLKQIRDVFVKYVDNKLVDYKNEYENMPINYGIDITPTIGNISYSGRQKTLKI